MWIILWTAVKAALGKFWKWIAGFFVAVGLFFYAFFKGRKSRERQLYLDNAEVNRRMYEESLKAPKSKDELVERIREKGL